MKKKAQEEMVGLVLIILVVAVIFLVFLGLFVRQSQSQDRVQSSEVSQFLDAALEFTTSCTKNSGYTYSNLEDLIIECNNGPGNICEGGEEVCSLANSTLKELIESTWQFGPESRTTGYESSAVYLAPNADAEEVFSAPTIPCTDPSSIRGADKAIFTTNGRIILTLELC